MELLQLQYFCDAASTENFSKTAKKFGVPPSAVSQSIRRLEKELAVTLFIRQANRILLNDHGAEFYKRISEALALIGDAMTAVTDDGSKGKMDICVNTNRRIVMQTVEKFKKQYPNIHIRTKIFSDPTAEDFDLIISGEEKRLKNYKKQLLISEKLAIAVNRNSRFAELEELDIAALASEPFITMNEQSSLFDFTNTICADFGFKPHITIQSDDPFYVRKCVELGLGVALVPLFSWQGQFDEKIVLKPIPGYRRSSFIYTDAKKYMPLCTKRFLKLLIAECSAAQLESGDCLFDANKA